MSDYYSEEEMRAVFIESSKQIAAYWAGIDGISKRDVADGVLHSMLCILDGVSGSFPCAVDLVMRPHPDDKQFRIDNGEKYVVDGQVINNCYLHEIIYDDGKL